MDDNEIRQRLVNLRMALMFLRDEAEDLRTQCSQRRHQNLRGYLGVASFEIAAVAIGLKEAGEVVGAEPRQCIEMDHEAYERAQLLADRYKRQEER